MHTGQVGTPICGYGSTERMSLFRSELSDTVHTTIGAAHDKTAVRRVGGMDRVGDSTGGTVGMRP
jgi:hypothetical protein